MIQDVPLYLAFGAGLISFLSPCVLPLVPAYVSFISGVSVQDLSGAAGRPRLLSREKRETLLHALIFMLGFSAVFILLGASATMAGSFLTANMPLLTKAAGAVIVFFGLLKMGLIRLLFLCRTASFTHRQGKRGLAGAGILGASFAFGWTPCVGPVLAGILAYAGTLERASEGLMLLSAYSLGMGLPFLLTALGVNRFFRLFDRIKRHLPLIERISGLIMVILGLMIFFNKLLLIPGYLPFLNRFAL